MKKNMKIASIIAVLTYIGLAIEGFLAYMMSDVWGLSWYIRLCNGMTYTQLMAKALSNPWLLALYIVELGIVVPGGAILVSKLWWTEESKREAAMN